MDTCLRRRLFFFNVYFYSYFLFITCFLSVILILYISIYTIYTSYFFVASNIQFKMRYTVCNKRKTLPTYNTYITYNTILTLLTIQYLHYLQYKVLTNNNTVHYLQYSIYYSSKITILNGNTTSTTTVYDILHYMIWIQLRD